ncbi:VOC family protein [Chryseobacterium sp. MFBS3-17]|uniref:VOC family protein n=1 Tax=Chryseobacterium sp. MFBS3-17 TaxID=2886689 RepID=UPI001D0ED60A|nr:VOC family protein [Chryseobacterium sp. MFBS3-17]MCC2590082.1 VOC family protein [Chryseobacterium sp. MFBS3-17]
MKLNPYLNFDGNCEEAFNHYKNVFRTGFAGNGVMKFSDVPGEGMPPMSDDIKNRVMHVSIQLGDQMLMGSDTMPGMGKPFSSGINNYISVHPDSREEADRIFAELSEGGEVEMPMEDQFWGDYFGSLIDRFGTPWMINFNEAYN